MKDLSDQCKDVEPSLTLKIGALVKAKKASGDKVISFATGEPVDKTPEYIANAGKYAIDNSMTTYTPTQGTQELRQAIVEYLKTSTGNIYSVDNIVVSNGAKQSLYNTILALIDKDDDVIIPSPYWVSYPQMVRLSHGDAVIVDTTKTGFKLTPQMLEEEITKKTKLVIINSPCNPSGVVYSKQELLELSEVIIDKDLWVISDEIYSGFVYDTTHVSIASLKDMQERTIVVGGMSKMWSMTGWRIGWAACDATLAKAMTAIQSHTTSCASSISQYAATVGLNSIPKDYFSELKKDYDDKRLQMMELLDKLSLDYIIPKGAFYIMVSVADFIGQTLAGVLIENTLVFATTLLSKYGVAVVPCDSFGVDGYVRFSYTASKTEIAEGMALVGKFLEDKED